MAETRQMQSDNFFPSKNHGERQVTRKALNACLNSDMRRLPLPFGSGNVQKDSSCGDLIEFSAIKEQLIQDFCL